MNRDLYASRVLARWLETAAQGRGDAYWHGFADQSRRERPSVTSGRSGTAL
jgi:hypothetical protein